MLRDDGDWTQQNTPWNEAYNTGFPEIYPFFALPLMACGTTLQAWS
jgi:hypothetical protein